MMTLGAPSTLKQPAPTSWADKRLLGAAQDFEGLLLEQMLTEMRKAHLAKDPLDQGQASNIMHSMLDAEMGKEIAHQRSLGIADEIYHEFKPMVHGGKSAPLTSGPTAGPEGPQVASVRQGLSAYSSMAFGALLSTKP